MSDTPITTQPAQCSDCAYQQPACSERGARCCFDVRMKIYGWETPSEGTPPWCPIRPRWELESP